MSTGSTIFQLRRLAALSLVGFWLAGCSSGDNSQAPISQIGDGGGMNTASDQTNTPSGGVPAMPSQGGMLSNNTASQQSNSGMISADNAVQTQNGRIVYNRSYQNIPKGSYSGETYTVKRGDTLFYIAWITGNDFRDLAQRNNVSAPYGLNVGQTLQIGDASGQPITGGNAITVADATQGASQHRHKLNLPLLHSNLLLRILMIRVIRAVVNFCHRKEQMLQRQQLLPLPHHPRSVVRPTVQRRWEAGVGRLMGRLSITSLLRKVAIKVSISLDRADNLLSPPHREGWFTQVTLSGVTVI